MRLPELAETAVRAEPWDPPLLGPGAYRLRFAVPAELRADFLAEPVVWVPHEPVPVADVFAPPTPPRGWHPLADGSFCYQNCTTGSLRPISSVRRPAASPR